MLTQDATQRLMIIIFLLLDLYRILIGSFYSIFVPQLCPDDVGPGTHTCTVRDNVTNLTLFNKAVLVLNIVTATLMIAGFIVEFNRETWMVKHLEVDPKKPDSNLPTEIEAYPELKVGLIRRNHLYRGFFMVIAVLSTANIVTSGILVFDYYDGVKTATTYVTNVLLIIQRIIKSIRTSYACDKELRAQSVYLLEQVTFNTIDPDFRKPAAIEMTNSPMRSGV